MSAVVVNVEQPLPTTREAIVARVEGPRAVVLEDGARATVATVGDYVPCEGDLVLIHQTWVVGVLRTLREVPRTVKTSDGVEAAVSDDVLTVRASGGDVLFTHCAATGQSTIRARDLQIAAAQELSLEAGHAVRVKAKHIALSAEEQTTLESPRLSATHDEARLSAKSATYAIKRLQGMVDTAKHVVGVAETRAQRIVERTKDAFREVEGVAQTRAGRIRTVAKAAYSVVANRATVRAETDMHIQGDKIHLA